MIIEFLFNVFHDIIALALSPIEIMFRPLGSLAGFLELLAYASVFVPLDAIGLCISIWLVFQFTQLSIVIVNWLVAKIPFIE